MAKPATASIPQQASLVSRWSLDDSPTWGDSVGDNTLTASNMASGAGLFGFTASGDFEEASSGYLIRADDAGLSQTGDLTLTALVKLESAPGTDEFDVFASKRDGPNDKRSYEFGYRDEGGTKKLFFRGSSNGLSGTEVTVGVTTTLTVGTEYFVGVSYDASAGSAAFYVAGAQVGVDQTGLPTSLHDNNSSFVIGTDNEGGGGVRFDGLMNDVCLFGGVVLSDAEHTTFYALYTAAAAVTVTPSGLLLMGVG